MAVPANGIAMRAACDKCHIVSGSSDTRAEITSDGTYCHNGHPHVVPGFWGASHGLQS